MQIEHKKTLAHKLYQHRIWIVLLIAFIGLSTYVGFLSFGNKSFLTLSKNQKIEKTLKEQIDKLHNENALLQKKFFELKSLEP
ncbi:MAG: hypothetical protein E7K04_04090 [Helicobacter sp.]|nr:hypothetical protein [Helicobacter sp.]